MLRPESRGRNVTVRVRFRLFPCGTTRKAPCNRRRAAEVAAAQGRYDESAGQLPATVDADAPVLAQPPLGGGSFTTADRSTALPHALSAWSIVVGALEATWADQVS